MFGYVRPLVPELKVKDHEFYRSIYCGLCKTMGHCTGCLSRFTLNYDFVFLCAVLLAANEEPFEIKRGRCIAHPFKARAYMAENETLRRCARLSALLVYYKEKDDAADSSGAKKLLASLLLPFLSYAKKKAKNDGALEMSVEQKLSELSALEKGKIPSPDPPAALFGELLGEICRAGIISENEALGRIAYKIGYHTGRWIYALDALLDMPEDKKSGNYNPYLLSLGEELSDSDKKMISTSLTLELVELEKAIALLSYGERELLKDLIDNILFAGLPATAKKALFTEDTDK